VSIAVLADENRWLSAALAASATLLLVRRGKLLRIMDRVQSLGLVPSRIKSPEAQAIDSVIGSHQGLGAAGLIAHAFHETYERLAPDHSYETREASAKPWAEVPRENQVLMVAVAAELLDRGVVTIGRTPDPIERKDWG